MKVLIFGVQIRCNFTSRPVRICLLSHVRSRVPVFVFGVSVDVCVDVAVVPVGDTLGDKLGADVVGSPEGQPVAGPMVGKRLGGPVGRSVGAPVGGPLVLELGSGVSFATCEGQIIPLTIPSTGTMWSSIGTAFLLGITMWEVAAGRACSMFTLVTA